MERAFLKGYHVVKKYIFDQKYWTQALSSTMSFKIIFYFWVNSGFSATRQQ